MIEEGGASRPLRARDAAVLCHTHREGGVIAASLRALGVPVVVMPVR